MGLSRLAEMCRKCRFVDICPNKRMEALAYLPEPIASQSSVTSSANMAAPMLRETITIHVYGKPVTMYKDDLERMLYKQFLDQNFCK